MNRYPFRFAIAGLALGVVGWAVSDLPGQDRLQPKEGEEAVLGGLQDDLKGVERGRLTDLQSGKRAISDDPKVHRELVAKAARHYAYRLTMPRFQGLSDDAEKEKSAIPLSMNGLIQQLVTPLLLKEFRAKPRRTGVPNGNQVDYIELFAKELTKCLRDVLSRNSKPIVRVNAARMLALVAETEQEAVADTLVDVLRNPRESDGVKLYALRGLLKLFESGTSEQSVFKDPKREARAILALQEYIARKPDLPKDPMEVEALRYVRREAVRAMASTRHATVPNNKEPAGRTAWWLLKVARKDGLTPEPSLSEQMEAAIGACQLRGNKDLQSDYLAYHAAGVLVDFLSEFNRAKLGGSEANLAWKSYATRFGFALDELKNQTKNSPDKTVKYVNLVVDQARAALKPFESKNPNPDPTVLDQWLRKNPPPSTTVYKSATDSTVKSPIGADN